MNSLAWLCRSRACPNSRAMIGALTGIRTPRSPHRQCGSTPGVRAKLAAIVGLEPTASALTARRARPVRLMARRWSGLRESNSPLRFGRPRPGHWTKPALSSKNSVRKIQTKCDPHAFTRFRIFTAWDSHPQHRSRTHITCWTRMRASLAEESQRDTAKQG